ncbi:MAG: 2OG-Fe(II) oxygenase family protein [Candidatus Woesearchaeota archaeon]|jgi:Rps23 Pro-64 3,4-dihydroxylase Tpa1-like proline 4-hydroxylase
MQRLNPRIEALKGWIQPEHFQEPVIKKYTKEFQNNKPFPHLLITNFLQPKQLDFLLKALEKQPFEPRLSDQYNVQQTEDLRYSTSYVFSSFYTMLTSSYFVKMMEEITGILKLKNNIDLTGLNFPQGGFYKPHNDYADNRRLAYILYLTPTLTKKDGGTLELFTVDKENVPKKIIQSYPPIQNSLIIFQVTRQSAHQVTPLISEKKRMCLSGWFHG